MKDLLAFTEAFMHKIFCSVRRSSGIDHCLLRKLLETGLPLLEFLWIASTNPEGFGLL